MESNGKGHIDWFILVPVIGLMLFSIAFVYSASATIAEVRFGDSELLFWRHSLMVAAGIVIMLIFSKIDYHLLQKFSKIGIFAAVISLVAVFLIGVEINGAQRWIDLGFVNFQPSELAKFTLVLHLASIMASRQKYIKDFHYSLLPMLIWTTLVCALIALQPNFSTALVIFIIALFMMFIGNTNLLHLGGMAFLILSGAAVYAVSASYRLQRLLSFFGMSDSSGIDAYNFQVQQAIIAFGNGGLIGVGPGQSRQSHLFLPESYGDFIFSIIGEEYGFIGTALIIMIFAFILWRGMITAKRAPDSFGYLLAMGITITITVYAFVSSGVNCGLLPTTGLPIPFVSYGGTAVLIYSAAIGILLNISSQTGIFPRTSSEIDNSEPDDE